MVKKDVKAPDHGDAERPLWSWKFFVVGRKKTPAKCLPPANRRLLEVILRGKKQGNRK
jgi:hypothetical protein